MDTNLASQSPTCVPLPEAASSWQSSDRVMGQHRFGPAMFGAIADDASTTATTPSAPVVARVEAGESPSLTSSTDHALQPGTDARFRDGDHEASRRPSSRYCSFAVPAVDVDALHFASTPLPRLSAVGHFSDEDEGCDELREAAQQELDAVPAPGSVRRGSSSSLAAPSSPVSLPPPSSSKHTPKVRANGSRIAAWLRSRVSQNKVRYRDEQFNLDLTYITHRIIAMGYPAHGTEYYIRNPIDKVEAFLDQRHPRHFRVYNLCSERMYDSVTRFHGQFKRFPFDDHNAPSLQLMCDFVVDAVAFLAESVENVVVVHCKAGKGRTGIMVSCLLFRLFPARLHNGQKAMEYFNTKRTCDGAGLTIPSQQRFVEYYERILREWNGIPPAVSKTINLREVVVNRVALQQPLVNPCDLHFTIFANDKPLLDSRTVFPKGPVVNEVGMVFCFPPPFVRLKGGIKVTFYRRRPIVLSGSESPGFYVWFNTNFCDTASMILTRQQLDKVDEATFTKTTTIGFRFIQAIPTTSVAAATE